MSDYLNKLNGFGHDIEVQLKHLLTTPDEAVSALDKMWQAIRHGALNGGKRLRPFLFVETATLCGATNTEGAMRAAAAVEMVHSYSLVHDDLPAMDDSDLRRGQPTVHKVYNEAIGVLVGDALLTEAFAVMIDEATHPQPAIRARLVAMLAEAAGPRGMVAGQVLDMAAEAGGSLDLDDLKHLHALKTGAMISMACCGGAVFAGTDAEGLRQIKQYADKIGLAFQIIDDVLDEESDAETLGKPVGQDKDNGKTTFVDLLCLQKSRSLARQLVTDAKSDLKKFGDQALGLQQSADYIVSRLK